ncbi:hypothetical protein [Paraburkholderia sp. J7]|uniref:hypothetical protein n=1 Tax=Paraburkholderia sp. J7 TaxID=2805438 RepID=UPI0039EE878D
MSTIMPAGRAEPERREPILNTVDRVCEICFDLFMALTFVDAVKAVTAGEDEGYKMFFAALGCNLAWGLADAVMYLVRTLADRGQRLQLAQTVKREQDQAVAVWALRDALTEKLASLVEDADLDRFRVRLAAASTLPPRANFVRGILSACWASFCLLFWERFRSRCRFSSSRTRPHCCWILTQPALILDVPFLLATFLLRVAFVLPALGVALLVCSPAVDLARSRLLFGSLVDVPALLALLRLCGGQSSAR